MKFIVFGKPVDVIPQSAETGTATPLQHYAYCVASALHHFKAASASDLSTRLGILSDFCDVMSKDETTRKLLTEFSLQNGGTTQIIADGLPALFNFITGFKPISFDTKNQPVEATLDVASLDVHDSYKPAHKRSSSISFSLGNKNTGTTPPPPAETDKLLQKSDESSCCCVIC